MKYKAIIVDDEQSARESLSGFVEEMCQNLEVVGEAANCAEAERLIDEVEPDLVFLDVEMP